MPSLSIKYKGTIYRVKPNPDNSGVRFFKLQKRRLVWLSTIIDDGKSLYYCESGLLGLRLSEKTYPTNYKEIFEYDIEEFTVTTPYNNKFIVQFGYNSNNEPTHFVIGFDDGNTAKMIGKSLLVLGKFTVIFL